MTLPNDGHGDILDGRSSGTSPTSETSVDPTASTQNDRQADEVGAEQAHDAPNNIDGSTATTGAQALDGPSTSAEANDHLTSAAAGDTEPTSEPTTAPAISSDIAAENARLREQNAQLQRELEHSRARLGADGKSPRQVRRIAVGVLLTLTCVGLLLSSVALWVNNEFLNTENWVELVTPLAHNPQVVNAVSAYAADEVVTALDVRQRTAEALPPKAQFLAVPLTQAVHDFAQKSVTRLMGTPQFEQLWIATNRSVHAEILAALRGQSKNVIITNGTVTLNLIPTIDQALKSLQQDLSGILPGNVQLPDVSQLQIPDQARTKLSQALGVQLPENFGEITLLSSAELAKAQQWLQIFDVLKVLLPIVTVLLFIATIWFSVDRRRTLIQFGIGVAVTFLIVRILIGYLAGQLVAGIANPTGHSIAGAVIPSEVSGLLTLTVLLVIAGVITAIIAYLAAKREWFVAAYGQGKAGYGWLSTKYQQIRG